MPVFDTAKALYSINQASYQKRIEVGRELEPARLLLEGQLAFVVLKFANYLQGQLVLGITQAHVGVSGSIENDLIFPIEHSEQNDETARAINRLDGHEPRIDLGLRAIDMPGLLDRVELILSEAMTATDGSVVFDSDRHKAAARGRVRPH